VSRNRDKQRAENRGKRADNRQQRAENRKQKADSRKQSAESRKETADSREKRSVYLRLSGRFGITIMNASTAVRWDIYYECRNCCEGARGCDQGVDGGVEW
jgi:hypothetical protein